MTFNEWLAIEVEGYDSGSVVAVPVLAKVAEMVAAEATIHGVERGVFLTAVIGAGLAIIGATGPAAPLPKFDDPK